MSITNTKQYREALCEMRDLERELKKTVDPQERSYIEARLLSLLAATDKFDSLTY